MTRVPKFGYGNSCAPYLNIYHVSNGYKKVLISLTYNIYQVFTSKQNIEKFVETQQNPIVPIIIPLGNNLVLGGDILIKLKQSNTFTT